nr:uncharacterized protein LOC129254365 isoform X1 [Lytechinus pictus]
MSSFLSGKGDNESGSSTSPSLSFQMVISGIKKMYPAVRNISTAEVEELLRSDEAQSGLVIVDARPEAEYNVSHIPSAVRIDPGNQNMDDVKKIIQDQLVKDDSASLDNKPIQVVMYCSVGYRSSALANRLRQALKAEKDKTDTATNHSISQPTEPSKEKCPRIRVFNMEGCLFKWANEGRQMVDGRGNITEFVHPYSIMWGQLISKDIRRWEGPRM